MVDDRFELFLFIITVSLALVSIAWICGLVSMTDEMIRYIVIAIFFGFLVSLVISKFMYQREPTNEELLRFEKEIIRRKKLKDFGVKI